MYLMDKSTLSAEDSENTNNLVKVSTTGKIITPFFAGAAAGALAKTTIAPLDRTKINFQITNKYFTMKEAWRFIHNSYRTFGVLSLWRGNSATMARVIPYASIQFGAHEQWKHALGVVTDEERKSKPALTVLAGSLAGIVSTTCTYPLDFLRARMAVTSKEKYNTLRQTFFKIVRTEGCSSLYKGYTPTVLGIIPLSGFTFSTYETLKRLHRERTSDRPLHPFERLVFGVVAGSIGQSVSYPFDTIRRRMQTATITGRDYRTVRGTMKSIIQEEGFFTGLYKGLSMTWIKSPIAMGISFTTFDITHHFLQRLYILMVKLGE